MLTEAQLEVAQVPGYGKPKVLCATVRVHRSALSTGFWKELLGMASEQAKHMISSNIGTALGTYSFHCEKDCGFFSQGEYLKVTATWTSKCCAIKPPKPPLEPKDIFGE